MPIEIIFNHRFVTVERLLGTADMPEAFDVVVRPKARGPITGFVIEAVSDRDDAVEAGEQLAAAFDSWMEPEPETPSAALLAAADKLFGLFEALDDDTLLDHVRNLVCAAIKAPPTSARGIETATAVIEWADVNGCTLAEALDAWEQHETAEWLKADYRD